MVENNQQVFIIYPVCQQQVDNRPFFENCVKDSCACDSGGDCECFCTAVAAYAQACNEAGVCVKWRTPDMCRKQTFLFLSSLSFLA